MTATADAPAIPAPALAEGVELIGRYQGSGYKEPRFLLARPDGQVIQAGETLYRLAAALDGRRTPAELATVLGAELDRPIDAETVAALVRDKLAPAGLIADVAADPVEGGHTDHLTMLRHRAPLVPASVSWVLAGVFRPLHRPVVVVVALLAFLAVDVAVLAGGGLGGLAPGTLALVGSPLLTLAVLALLVVAGLVHECGHISACRYGGARPGPMGVGIYLVWPAFYSTVTDSYRLSRAGRLRTDLGGVYFNALVITAVGAAYLATGAVWLLPALLLLHIETARQFLPSIRLDGYYILADLIGLPDLFTFLRPVLRGLLPGATPDSRVAALRPVVRRVIVAWVLFVVPFLAVFVGSFLVLIPQVLPAVADATAQRVATAAAAVRAGDAVVGVLAVAQGVLAVLPVVGGALVLASVLRQLAASLLPPRTRGTGSGRTLALVGGVVALIGLLAVAALDQRPAAPAEALLAAGAGPDVVAGQQLAAVELLLGGWGGAVVLDAARTATVVLVAVAALLLWPIGRRLELSPGLAGAAVVVAAGSAVLLGLAGTVDPGAVGVVWLVAAAGLAGRGRGGRAAALLATGLAVLSAPVAAVGVAAFAAHAVATGQLAGRLPPRGRRVFAGLAAVVAVAAAVVAPGSGAGGPGTVTVLGLVLVGAVLAGFTWRAVPPLRPVLTGIAALLAVAAVPGPRAGTAALLVLPALAVLAVATAARTVFATRPGFVLPATLLALALCAAPLVRAAAAPDPDPHALARWIDTQLDPDVTVLADPLTAAQLLADGVPAQRLAPGTGRTVVVGDGPGRPLLRLPDGPAHTPVTVHEPVPGDRGPTGPEGADRTAADPAPTPGPDPAAAPVAGPGTPATGAGPALPAVGAELARNPAVAAPARVRDALAADRVDPRLVIVLSGLAGTHRFELVELPAVPGEPAEAPLRTAVLAGVDGSPVAVPGATVLVERWLLGQQPPFRPTEVAVRDGLLVVRFGAPSPS